MNGSQLYFAHLRGEHTGDVYAEGCPTCEGREARPVYDPWGRSIAKMEADLAAAHAACDAAAAATSAAYDAWNNARTLRAEDKAMAVWQKLREKQNAAAGRLHAANTALGRPARDDRRPSDDADGRLMGDPNP